jgi:hypothetical protein
LFVVSTQALLHACKLLGHTHCPFAHTPPGQLIVQLVAAAPATPSPRIAPVPAADGCGADGLAAQPSVKHNATQPNDVAMRSGKKAQCSMFGRARALVTFDTERSDL